MSASLRVMQALAAVGLKRVIRNEPPDSDGHRASLEFRNAHRRAVLSGENEDVHGVALRQPGFPFRHDDQRVGLAERGDLV